MAEPTHDGCQLSGGNEAAPSLPAALDVTTSVESDAADGSRQRAADVKVLTEDGLKELLYTSCSSESPEFESIINLYLDQVKSHSEEITSPYSDPSQLETIFKNSGLYSKLKLDNFVRLGPSTIGYPSASWKNISDNDKRLKANCGNQSEPTRMKLKLWITRETHPTPEDLRNDIVLKMIIVDEVNRKGLMGPLRAYLTPEGDVEFHTGSPDQKEGLEEFVRGLFENAEKPSDQDGLDLETVVYAITETVKLDMAYEGSSSSNGEHSEIETSNNAVTIEPDGAAITKEEQQPDNGDIPKASNFGTTSSDDAAENREISDSTPDVLEGFVGKTSHAGKRKPPLWHRGVDLNEVFMDVFSDESSDTEDDNQLPTAAELKMLQLLRSSSSGEDVSDVSGYSDEDIDAALRGLMLGERSSECDGGDECVDSDEMETAADVNEMGLSESSLLGRSEVGSPAPVDNEPADGRKEESYSRIRPLESPLMEQLSAANSLRDLGLQIIDPMGVNVISKLRFFSEAQLSSDKSEKSPDKPAKSPEKSGMSEKKSSAQNGKATSSGILGSVKSDDGSLNHPRNLADELLPEEETLKVESNRKTKKAKGKGQDPSGKPPDKTVPAILGKMPEPTSLGFSRHLGPAGPARQVASLPPGQPHPALGAPLIQRNQWFPVLVPVGPSNDVLPQPPTGNFQLEIFSKWPDEFGRFVAHSLSMLGIEQRMRAIENISAVLNQSLGGFAPNSNQRVQFNMVRPSMRPPFSQMACGANQNPANAQPNSAPQNRPPVNSSSQKHPVTGNSQFLHMVQPQYNSHSSEFKRVHLPQPGSSSAQSPKTPPKKTAEPAKNKSKTGKTAKTHLDRVKILRAAKKLAKKAQADAKLGKTKSFSVYPSRNTQPNPENAAKPAQPGPVGSTAAPKPQPTAKPQTAQKKPQPKNKPQQANQTVSQNPHPKPGSSKPKPGSNASQNSTESNAVNHSKKAPRSQANAKKKQSKQPQK